MDKVLDLGASWVPDYRATHAVDLDTDSRIHKKVEDWVIKNQALPLGLSLAEARERQKFRKKVKLTTGVDYTKELPYPDKYFDGLVSHSSVAAFGTPKTYREAYRVLKPGGYFQVGAAALKEKVLNKVVNQMQNTEFVEIKIKKRQPDTRAMVRGLNRLKVDLVAGIKPQVD